MAQFRDVRVYCGVGDLVCRERAAEFVFEEGFRCRRFGPVALFVAHYESHQNNTTQRAVRLHCIIQIHDGQHDVAYIVLDKS